MFYFHVYINIKESISFTGVTVHVGLFLNYFIHFLPLHNNVICLHNQSVTVTVLLLNMIEHDHSQ